MWPSVSEITSSTNSSRLLPIHRLKGKHFMDLDNFSCKVLAFKIFNDEHNMGVPRCNI